MTEADQAILVGVIIGWGLHAWVVPYFKSVWGAKP